MEEGVVEKQEDDKPVEVANVASKFTQQKNRAMNCRRDLKTGKWIDYDE